MRAGRVAPVAAAICYIRLSLAGPAQSVGETGTERRITQLQLLGLDWAVLYPNSAAPISRSGLEHTELVCECGEMWFVVTTDSVGYTCDYNWYKKLAQHLINDLFHIFGAVINGSGLCWFIAEENRVTSLSPGR
jgi:hypothetical protein